MNYPETLTWLFNQLPMYQRVGGAAYKADLQATLNLMAHLGNPEDSFKSIHVAGTNGKGSVSHALASVFMANDYSTGLYTSPHLKDFRERIKLSSKEDPRRGRMISEESVVDFINEHRPWFETNHISFFEMTVGLAFEYFRRTRPDIAIIEVGMGGRLDSTNVLTPELCVITNIGHDHQKFLGDSLAQIASEKAGIIKAGIPVIIGEKHFETEPVFRAKAEEVGAPIYFAEEMDIDLPESDLTGPYQHKNLRTAAAAIKVYRSLPGSLSINDTDLAVGFTSVLPSTGLQGRWQVIQENPKVILDGGHNAEALPYLLDRMKTETPEMMHFVLGFVNDKDLGVLLNLYPKNARYYFTRADIPRALPENELQDLARSVGLTGQAFKTVRGAVEAAKKAAGTEDIILVGGSFFVVAEMV